MSSALLNLTECIAPQLAAVERVFHDELKSELPGVDTLVKHVSRFRGKMLRPTLLLLAGKACGELNDAHVTLATVVEMVHMATLVHDDVLDEAELRRKGATINHLRGNEAAVLLGDYLISHSYHLCSSLDSQLASRTIARTTNQVCEGELLQIDNRNNLNLDEKTYLKIIARKTAVLCATCCFLGAHLSGASEEVCNKLETYGMCLGTAFQIQDDILDIVGDTSVVGKTLGIDVDKGKLTLPAIHFLRHAPQEHRALLRSLLSGHDADKAEKIRNLIVPSDSIAYAQKRAKELIEQAQEQLQCLPDSEPRRVLETMAQFRHRSADVIVGDSWLIDAFGIQSSINDHQIHLASHSRYHIAVQEVWIFANPIAGRGKGERIAKRIAQRVALAEFQPVVIFDRADSLEASQLKGDVRAAVVIGGDGTLRTVCDALVRLLGPERVPPIVVVPMGTANLMGRHLDVDWRDRNLDARVVEAIVARKIVMLDVARANDKLFLLMVGVGIDAHIVHELDRVRDGPIDLTSYILPAAMALQAYDYPAIEVSVDGRRVFPKGPGMAFVGNVPEYGTGFPVLTHARSDDGLLDVCVLPVRSRQEILKMALLALAGEHVDAEGVVYLKGKHVQIDAPESIPVQVDGDPAGHTPLTIDLLPFRLPFIVPPSTL